MKLYLYFARRFLGSFIWLFVAFLLLSFLLEMIEVLRRFDSSGVSFLDVVRLTSLRLPASLYDILPLVVILATLMMFLNLARSSELVIARAAGRSALRSLFSPVVIAILIGVVLVAGYNPIVAATSKQYEVLSNRFDRGQASVLSVSREGLWLRQVSEEGQTVIRAARANLDGTALFSVTFIGFSETGEPAHRIEAETATLAEATWVLTNAKKWKFAQGEISELTAETFDEMLVPTNLTQAQIQDGFGEPRTIPIWELPAFIERLKSAGFSARRHEMWFQTELAKPAFLVAMVLIGAAFTMRHTRAGRTGLMILLALLTGFTIFFIRNFAIVLGENGQIPILLAAWAPPVAGIFLALGLILHVEGG